MYAKVALNLPINKLFTYSIPEYLIGDVSSGKRVVVNFGRKVTTAIIVSVSKISVIEKIKPIQSVLDEEPVVTEKMFSFGEWMSEYYLSTLGECLFLSIPRNTNIRSENYYRLSDDYISRFDKFKH
jgi:Primosomal protein N' (replication factor Y) - superfamily II helicase